jgi:hypothetical protein
MAEESLRDRMIRIALQANDAPIPNRRDDATGIRAVSIAGSFADFWWGAGRHERILGVSSAGKQDAPRCKRSGPMRGVAGILTESGLAGAGRLIAG